MFGISKERLVKSLCRLSCQVCGYIGGYCDCKYMKDPPSKYFDEATGCPELLLAAKLIGMMTGDEFYLLAARAGIEVDPQAEKFVMVDDFVEQCKKDRFSTNEQ